MLGWMAQKYGYVPLELNVNVKDCPLVSDPEFHIPVSLVVVWVKLPLLVHFTHPPALMVTLAGEKLKSAIETVLQGGGEVAVGVAVWVAVGVGEGVLLPKLELSTIKGKKASAPKTGREAEPDPAKIEIRNIPARKTVNTKK